MSKALLRDYQQKAIDALKETVRKQHPGSKLIVEKNAGKATVKAYEGSTRVGTYDIDIPKQVPVQ